ncbi:anti-sigma factor RsiW [Catenulispora sp. GAS73]|uniref:hypothetical protein n=1 Tax=Catenulispora sp. GAS73 TaxID=3156269 RepID=UPI003514E6A3
MMTDPAASRPGTHLDPDQIADLVEGLLDDAAADEARAHLASCPLCSADFALITGEGDLADLSGSLPPMPIPQDVVARVEAALYREPPLATASAAPAAAPAAAAAQPRHRRFRIALGSLAGAALVVTGGIGVVTALNSATGSSKESSSTAAGNGAAPNAAGSFPGGESQAGGAETHASEASPPMSITQQAEALLGQHMMTANGTAQTARPDCRPSTVPAGTKLITSGQTVYQGKPAWLLLYPGPGSATLVDVYVVDVNACTSGNPVQSLTQFVITRS